MIYDCFVCFLPSVPCSLPWPTTTSDSMTNSMQRFSQPLLPMDPQECPPPLSSSQSVISGLDKSPASTFRPGHSRSNSTGSSKHTKQVAGRMAFFTQKTHWHLQYIVTDASAVVCPFSRVTGKCWTTCSGWTCVRWRAPLLTWVSQESVRETWWKGGSTHWMAGTR